MADKDLQHLPLGKPSHYPERLSPDLLCPIPRHLGRDALGLVQGEPLPFTGEDVWQAYELSWLDSEGKPQLAVARIVVPCDSPNIVESKSLKLYFNSFNMTAFASAELVRAQICNDLGACIGVPVTIEFQGPQCWPLAGPTADMHCLDELPLAGVFYQPNPSVLNVGEEYVEERLLSHLLRSRCPVTGQPDWASLVIHYQGQTIDHGALLAYIVSYREHQGFHEQCIEQIFLDLMQRCQPDRLSVSGYFLRRGGIDINPRRAHNIALEPMQRLARQ